MKFPVVTVDVDNDFYKLVPAAVNQPIGAVCKGCAFWHPNDDESEAVCSAVKLHDADFLTTVCSNAGIDGIWMKVCKEDARATTD